MFARLHLILSCQHHHVNTSGLHCWTNILINPPTTVSQMLHCLQGIRFNAHYHFGFRLLLSAEQVRDLSLSHGHFVDQFTLERNTASRLPHQPAPSHYLSVRGSGLVAFQRLRNELFLPVHRLT